MSKLDWPRGLAIRSMMHALDYLPHGHFIVEFIDGEQIEFDNFGQLASFVMHRERAAEAQVAELKKVLAELVACKDMKERIEWLDDAATRGRLTDSESEEWETLTAEYKQRKPLAWKAARDAAKESGK